MSPKKTAVLLLGYLLAVLLFLLMVGYFGSRYIRARMAADEQAIAAEKALQLQQETQELLNRLKQQRGYFGLPPSMHDDSRDVREQMRRDEDGPFYKSFERHK